MILPRAELDRRELAAYSAGWADVVDERLPVVRRAYEERITAAYLQGQEDARTGRRLRRSRRPEGERGPSRSGEVIPLPYVQLLRPPSEVTRVQQRGDRERSLADGIPVPAAGPAGAPAKDAAGPNAESRDRSDGPGPARDPGRGQVTAGAEPSARARQADPSPPGGPADADGSGDGVDPPGAATVSGSGAGVLLSAREVRERRTVPAERRPVVRRNGRPSVPPLARAGDTGAGRDKGRRTEPEERREDPADPPAGRAGERLSLSDRARALADDLEGRAAGRRNDEPPGPADPR
ncbi:hypothetical protein ACFW1F_10100 [Streptomyces bungoensis]|uniref:hypothetical protein n=1 Tax=Streptomyces bungoensis TaxID=285568 RepID=UPI0036C9B296